MHEVAASLPLWPVSSRTTATLISRSENTTYRLDDPAGPALALRVQRVGYNSRAAIESELAWILALRRDDPSLTPEPVAGRDGALVQTLPDGRHAVAFAFVPGHQPDGDLPGWFGVLGRITARLHAHAEKWRRPAGFVRRRWDAAAMFGPDPVWGAWQVAPGLSAGDCAVLARGEALIRRELAGFGEAPDRFGLIHADLRLTNLLVDAAHLHVIDFDDCGFGWHAYDFAAAVSFFEDAPEVPDLLACWLAGYRTVRSFCGPSVHLMPIFIAARRLLLTAWCVSHPGAAPVGPSYASGTVAMLENLLLKY